MKVSLRVSAEDAGAGRTVGVLKGLWNEFTAGLKDGMNQARAEAAKTRAEVDKTAASIKKAGDAGKSDPFAKLVAGAKAFVGLAVVRQIATMSDEMANLEGRVKLVTGSVLEQNAAMAEIFAISQRTGTSLEATGTLYVRLSQALKDTGASQREVFTITETVNRAMAISGASASEAQGAIVQLSQAFASGALRGDEFNSVNEAAPRIMDALAKSLGVTRGQLRQMAQEGKLTSDTLRKALSGEQANVIATEFAKLPLTVGRAWQQLMNSVTQATGRITQDSGAFSLVANLISGVAKAIDFLVPKLEAWGALWGQTFRDGYASAVQLAQYLGTTFLQTFADMTGGSKEAATALRDDLLGGLGDLAQQAVQELQILPVSLRTIATIIIGELDKLRISGIEKFQLLVVAAEQAWLSLRASTTSLANDMRQVIGSALDGIIAAYAKLVGGIGSLAGKLGLDSLQSKLSATSASLLGMADSEAKAKAAADASSASYAAERAALDQRAATIRAGAAAQRSAADVAISASLDERTAALANLNVQQQALAISDKAGKDLTKKAVDAKAAAAAAREQAKAASELANAEKSALDMIDGLSGEMSASAKAQADFDKGTRELTQRMQEWAIKGGDVTRILRVWQQGEALLKSNLTKTNAEIRARNALSNGNKDLAEDIARQADSLAGLSSAQIAYNEGVREANQLAREAIQLGLTQEEVDKDLADRLKKLGELRDNAPVVGIVQQFGQKSDYDQIVENLGRVEEAIKKTNDPKLLEPMMRARERLNAMQEQQNLGLLQQGVSSLQQFAKEGTAAYTALGIAQDLLAYKAAVTAIATQGGGDPYTAFARIAAMIALMASIGIRVAGGGGNKPSAQSAEVRQAQQGTGSILGDATAKSESIAKATEITANATQQLVGLNRGMLTALVALQNALGAAGNQLARGAGNANFPGLQNQQYGLMGPLGQFNPLLNAMTGGNDPIGNAIGSFLWGGKQKIIDQGIVVAGGALSDMLNNIVVGAYQTIHTSGGLFGGGGTHDNVVDISDSFGKQFQLVISSIADTVRQGALALGMLPDDVEKAIANFRVEEIRISLKGLSAEDQQKELEAVFSKIFDDLAGSVVPFIGQFQQVGEGLGETLVRIATEVQVTQEAFRQLGLAVDETDPEKFAQIADGLIQAAGGVDNFIEGMNAFVNAFSTPAHQLEVAGTALKSALEQVGLAVPATRDGMWQLMQSLDATTAEGQQQIATLLRLAGVADQYYDMLDQQADTLKDAIDKAKETLGGLSMGGVLSDFQQQILDIRDSSVQVIDALNTLARAQGLEGATALQIGQTHAWVAQQVAAAIQTLKAETMDLISQLYGGTPGTLDEVNRRITAAGGDPNYGLPGYTDRDTGSGGAGAVSSDLDELFKKWQDGLERIQDFLDSILLDQSLTTLTPEQQLNEAMAQYQAALIAAQGGDADALASLPDLAQQLLTIGRGYYSSGDQYTDLFNMIQHDLGGLANLQNPGQEGPPLGSPGNPYQVGPSPELVALYDQRDAMLAQQEAQHRAQLAADLAQHLNDLAHAIDVPVFDLMNTMNVSLTDLAADLGINLETITGASVQGLANMATLLGVSLTALTTELGLTLTDLGGGITELATQLGIDMTNLTGSQVESLAYLAQTLGLSLTEITQAMGYNLTDLSQGVLDLTNQLGIDLSNLTVESTQSLAQLAQHLGTDLATLSQSVGVDLGNLADSQSLLNQALHDQIDSLPEAQRDQLAPLLEAVENATTEADANAAIDNLEAAVNLLTPDLRNALAPYFEDLAPQVTDPTVLALNNTNNWLSQMLAQLRDIADNTAHSGTNAGGSTPQFATGASMISRTGLATIHEGEMVIDETTAARLRGYGIAVSAGGGGGGAAAEEVRALRQQQAVEAERTANQLNTIAAKQADTERAVTRLEAAQGQLANAIRYSSR